MNEPLAIKLRPRILVDIVGQDHLIGEGKQQKIIFYDLIW